MTRLRIGIIGEPYEFGAEPPGPISHGVKLIVTLPYHINLF